MPLNDNLNLGGLSEEEQGRILSGMRSPTVVTLRAGEILFHFAGSTKLPHLWAAGPWWVYEQDYLKIVEEQRRSQARHGRDGLTIGYLGRAALGVQPSWGNRMDVVVKAVVNQDVNAFLGFGRAQYNDLLANGMRLTIQCWRDVQQLYIPNIGNRDGRTALGYQALGVLRQKIVSSQLLY